MNRELESVPAKAFGIATRRLPAQETGTEYFNIAGIMITLWRARTAIIGVALLGGLVAAAILLRTESEYTARAELQLLRRSAPLINIENVIDRGPFATEDVQAEISIITSYRLLRRVAERLDLAAVPEFDPPPSLLTQALRTARSLLPDTPGSSSNGGEGRSPIDTAVNELYKRVTVRQLGLSLSLQISVTSVSPQRAATIANAVAEEYLALQVEDKLNSASEATMWLEERLADLLRQVDAADAAPFATSIRTASLRATSLPIVAFVPYS